MTSKRSTALISLMLTVLVAPTALAQSREAWRAMNQPVEPFRIIGNLYYVGASDVTSFLITTSEGHILIDGGFEETVPLIRASMEKLGFDFGKIRILLNSHAHLDHAGGLARIKQLTGARLMASELDTPLLERGGLGDDLMGDDMPYTPVAVDRPLQDGDTVDLGETRLTARVTAGHTRGCTSWTMSVEENERSYLAVSICSLTILDGVKLTRDPTYPGIAEDYARSLETLKALPCDVFLASHARFFKMQDKRERQKEGAEPNPFIDPTGYRKYLERAEGRYLQRLESESVLKGTD